MKTQIDHLNAWAKDNKYAALERLISSFQGEGSFQGSIIAAVWMFGWPLLIL